VVPRLPGRVLWVWDGEFCGVINLRFVPGTLDLPPHVSGHAGYAIVPWKRRKREPTPTVDGAATAVQAALAARASLQFQGRSSLSLLARWPWASWRMAWVR